MENFSGKLAVITGGASGVGFAIGEALAKEGAKVILTDICLLYTSDAADE